MAAPREPAAGPTPERPGPSAGWLARAWPWLAFVLTPLCVFPWALLRAGLLQGGDDTHSNLPLLSHAAARLAELEVGWTPWLWLGTPLLAEPEFATLYLPKQLFLVLPPVAAFGVYVLGHFLGAQAFMYLYVRRLGLGRLAATFSAVAYGYGGFMLGHLGHTMYVVAGAWTPLYLYFLHRACAERRSVLYLGAALSFAQLPLAGAIQLTAYLAGMTVLLFGSYAYQVKRWRPLVTALVTLGCGGLVAAPQLLPSIAFADQLVVGERASFEFATESSFHPLLLPTLFVPRILPRELYTFCGISTLVAVGAGWLLRRRPDPWQRAWTAVAAAAVVLMLGRYVPLLPRLLHELPVLGVLRIPARHNYELGVACSVLAGIGIDRLARRDRPAPRLGPSLLAAAALLSATVVAALLSHALSVEVARQAYPLDLLAFAAGQRSALTTLALASVVTAVVATAVAMLSLSRRWPRVLLLLLVVELGVATRYTATLPDESVAEQIRSQDVRADPTTVARFVAPCIHVGNIRTLTGNSALLSPGWQNLAGYASLAHQDAATMLDLDAFGHDRHQPDLIWSRLPTVFGVTHLILPTVVCGAPSLALTRDDRAAQPCSTATPPRSWPLGDGSVGCQRTLVAGRRSYRLTAAADAPPDELEIMGAANVHLTSHEWGRRFEVFGDATPDGAERKLEPLSVPPAYRRWLLRLDDGEGRQARLEQLTYAELSGVLSLRRGRGHQASVDDDRVLLEPERQSAKLAVPVAAEAVAPAAADHETGSGPVSLGMSFEARALGGAVGGLVVDLYGGPRFDPEQAQVVIEPPLLDGLPRAYATTFELDAIPAEFSVRAFTTGPNAAEVRRLRLLAQSSAGAQPLPAGFLRAFVPVRPFLVEVDVEADAPPDRPLTVVLSSDPTWYRDELALPIDTAGFPGRRTVTRAITLSATAERIYLRAFTESSSPYRIHRIGAVDGCERFPYPLERRLDRNFALYRNPRALPRAYVVAELRAVPNVAAARRVLRDDPTFTPGEQALVQDMALRPSLGSAVLEEVDFGEQQVDIAVRAQDGPAFIVVNDRFDPHWVATIDEEPTRIYRVNGLVRGVLVPPGAHRIRMRYQLPRAVPLGFACAGLGLLLPWAPRRRLEPWLERVLSWGAAAIRATARAAHRLWRGWERRLGG